jgi:predicted metal-dependent peptidase
MDPKTAWPRARYLARKRAPYLSRLTTGIPAYATEAVPTLAVITLPNGAPLIAYNPAFLASLHEEVAATAVLHEVAHVYLNHAGRRGDRDPTIANLAADAALHEQFQAASWPLGEGWVTAAGLGLPRGGTFEQYYDALRKQGTPQPQPGKGPGGGTACGTGATGAPAPGEEAIAAAAAAEGYGQGADARTVERARVEVARAIKAHAAKHQGSIPGGWATVADEILAGLDGPAIPWARKLRRVVQRRVRISVGTGRQRYTKPSRRQGGLGYGPGRPVLPGHVRPIPEVTVIVDTSGSMGREEYRAILGELDGILAATGGRVTLYAVDAAVQSHGRVRSVRDALGHFKGGGGTSFDPAFIEIAKSRSMPDLVVYFTDGYGSVSVAAPAFPVVWVTTGKTDFPWGDVIQANQATSTP